MAIETHGLSRRFGSVYAVSDVTLSVATGDRCVLIGPNGAGKSTLFGLIAGSISPSSGSVLLHGTDITRLPDYRRAAMGLGRVFQTARLFDETSALRNVELAVHRRDRRGRAGGESTAPPTPTELLEAVGLHGRGNVSAGELSHGERRSLELALAIGTGAQTLLLDEPTSGMSEVETLGFISLIRELPPQLTVLIVEHNLDVAFEVGTTVCILDAGRLIFSGSSSEASKSVELRQAYLRDDWSNDDSVEA